MRNRSNSSDQSEVSDTSVNNRACFRASVCLKRYFQDHRARCYMLVPQRRRVRWLESRIKKVFSITDAFCLRSNGHLLPSSESLALLAPGDSIEVIPLNENKNEEDPSNANIKEREFPFESTRATSSDDLTSNGRDLIQNRPQETSTETSSGKVDDNGRSDRGTPHGTESYRTESIHSSLDGTDASKRNIFDEADGTPDALQEIKQRALELLGSLDPPRRSRRRVRRRRARASSPGVQNDEVACASPSPVQRNDAARARPPRVVEPLAAD